MRKGKVKIYWFLTYINSVDEKLYKVVPEKESGTETDVSLHGIGSWNKSEEVC